MAEFDYQFKIVVVGDAGVGKTQFIQTFCGQHFNESHTATVGLDCASALVFMDGKRVQLQIWDAPLWWGQDRFRTVVTNHYREAHGVIFVYDVNNDNSLTNVRATYDELMRHNKDCERMLVGTKMDKKLKKIMEPMNFGKSLAETLKMQFFELSAKSMPGPDSAFLALTRTLMAKPVCLAKPDVRDSGLEMPSAMYQSSTSSTGSEPPVDIHTCAAEESKTVPASASSSAGSYSVDTSDSSSSSSSGRSAMAMYMGDMGGMMSPAAKSPAAAQSVASPSSSQSTSRSAMAMYMGDMGGVTSPVAAHSAASPSARTAATTTQAQAQAYDQLFQVVLLGDDRVGKSMLIKRYVESDFEQDHTPTTAATSVNKDFDSEGKRVRLQLWDTPGQDRYRSAVANTLRQANGVIVMYDMSEVKTFEGAKAHLAQLEKSCPEKVRACTVLVGNKTDMQDKAIEYDTAKALADSYKIPFLEISVRASFNVDNVFRTLLKAMRAH